MHHHLTIAALGCQGGVDRGWQCGGWGVVLSSKFQVLSSKFQVLSSKFQVLSSKFQVLSFKFQVLSSKFLPQIKPR